jgi:hypothetical protein
LEGTNSCTLINREDVSGLDGKGVVVVEVLRQGGSRAKIENRDFGGNSLHWQTRDNSRSVVHKHKAVNSIGWELDPSQSTLSLH